MNRFALALAAAIAILAPAAFAADAAKADAAKAEEKRQAILKMRDETLERLYKEQPDARSVIEKGSGYAVFDATGVNLVLYVGGKGSGVLVDKASEKPVYMSMVRAGTGPGLGYKEFKQVIVFKNKKAIELFQTTGVDVGTSFDFGKVLAKGQSFHPDFTLYTITERGFTVQANWGGTKYFKDAELN